VRIHHALRLARRAGGVVDVRGRGGGDLDLGGLGGVAGRERVDVEEGEIRGGHVSHEGHGGCGHHRGCRAGVPQHMAEPLTAQPGLEGNVDPPRLQDSQDGRHERQALVDHDGDLLGPGTPGQDRPRHLIGPAVELRVREGGRSELDREAIGAGRDLPSESPRDALLDRGALERDESLAGREPHHGRDTITRPAPGCEGPRTKNPSEGT
jgi:hypothetical protein